MNREDEAREPVGTPVDEFTPCYYDGFGSPVYPWGKGLIVTRESSGSD